MEGAAAAPGGCWGGGDGAVGWALSARHLLQGELHVLEELAHLLLKGPLAMRSSPSASERAIEQDSLPIGTTDHMAEPVTPFLALAA